MIKYSETTKYVTSTKMFRHTGGKLHLYRSKDGDWIVGKSKKCLRGALRRVRGTFEIGPNVNI